MTLPGILEKYWGYSSFRSLQLEAMESVMAGRASRLVLPTGGGKSLCFQAPATAREGLAIFVSPFPGCAWLMAAFPWEVGRLEDIKAPAGASRALGL